MKHTLHVFSNLQIVVPPVRMEEHAVVHLILTVTVPVGTQDSIARTKVHMHAQCSALFHTMCTYSGL